MKNFLTLLAVFYLTKVVAQNNPNPGYWQQHVAYKMDVKMDV